MSGNTFGTIFKVTTFGESHGAGGGVIDFLRKHHDPVVQQSGEDVIGALASAGLLHNIRN